MSRYLKPYKIQWLGPLIPTKALRSGPIGGLKAAPILPLSHEVAPSPLT